ncbi:MAG: PA0069 family radical SAM protein, partial [Planctomycetota bacterium]
MSATGRSTDTSPGNRFESIHVELEPLEAEDELPRKIPTRFYDDVSFSVISTNASPDIPFRYSINPYRGCEHGCAYCYARPSHETLGMNAGIDFESKIVVKRALEKQLRKELNHKRWRGDHIMLSGVTDCYQPAEAHFRLTRTILEVFAESRQAFSIITKNRRVVRDLDLLTEAARQRRTQVYISLTTLDGELARQMEPRTSTPQARLRAIGELATAGVPVGVMVAPLIPGLNDSELPQLLAAAHAAGAQAAGTILLRLPLTVAPLFERWLKEHRPQDADRVLARIRGCRAGQLNGSQFGERMSGTGAYAATLFE